MSADVTPVTPGALSLAKIQAMPAMPEDEVLDFTQRVRRGVVSEMLKNGMPTESGDRALFVSMLDGLDRQAIGVKRIKADEKAASGLSEASHLVAQLLKEAGRTKAAIPDVIEAEARVIPTLGDEVPRPELVPGELDIAPRQQNYEEFSSSLSLLPEAPAGAV